MAAVRTTPTAKVLRRLEAAVLASDLPDLLYLFALNVPGASIAKLQRRVEVLARKLNNAKYAYVFARDVQGADIAALRRVVLKLDDHGWDEAFRRFVT